VQEMRAHSSQQSNFLYYETVTDFREHLASEEVNAFDYKTCTLRYCAILLWIISVSAAVYCAIYIIYYSFYEFLFS
jgi:hypothetical protein